MIMLAIGLLIAFASGMLGMFLDVHVGIKYPCLFWFLGIVGGVVGFGVALWGITK